MTSLFRPLQRPLQALRDGLASVPEDQRWPALTGLALMTLVAPFLAPALAAAQAGCTGTTINITNLDNLIKTAWEYLTSGAIIRVVSAAMFIVGIGAFIGRRAGAGIVAIVGGAIMAFLPSILDTLVGQGRGNLSICG